MTDLEYIKKTIVPQINILQEICHKDAKANGWWNKPPEVGTALMLMVSELGEACEAERKDIRSSEHIPEFSGIEEELADVIIRILDFAGYHNLRIADAIASKVTFNRTRGYKHGNKKF